MGFAEKFVKQCRKPEGLLGRFVGRVMNRGHARVRRWGLSHVSVKSHATVLDIGCGGGAALRDMALCFSDSKLYGIDYSQDMVLLAARVNKRLIEKGRIKITNGIVSSLPFSADVFDLATAFEAYYFWPDLIHDLQEIRRVLKPGGMLLIVIEVYENKRFHDRNKRWAAWAEMHLHSPKEYRDFLTKSGYLAVEIDEIPERNWIAAMGKKSELQT
ncbi:MAG TPA: methyltransferase domain-containing protein [Thermodesulfobacteriota bacterium]|nr:methyltransferase domain-containing protein [Thermodesulfobacteriota bacterium]